MSTAFQIDESVWAEFRKRVDLLYNDAESIEGVAYADCAIFAKNFIRRDVKRGDVCLFWDTTYALLRDLYRKRGLCFSPNTGTKSLSWVKDYVIYVMKVQSFPPSKSLRQTPDKGDILPDDVREMLKYYKKGYGRASFGFRVIRFNSKVDTNFNENDVTIRWDEDETPEGVNVIFFNFAAVLASFGDVSSKKLRDDESTVFKDVKVFILYSSGAK